MSSLESPSLPSRGATRTDSHDHNLVNGRVNVVPYDPKWPYLFQREADRIRQALGERVLVIEHIGSTAVPGLDAKACIDIRLGVADPTDEPAYLPELEEIGYSVRVGFEGEHDHRLLKGSRVNVNLYVGTRECPALERMSLFRDHLIADAGARERYAAVKRELGEREWEHLQDYTGAKGEIITELMAEAESWKASRSPN
ncbi:GrpB family protein [Nocardiopsis sp. NPDC006832]|uniref:GrpB family protein n=1 Tax=Nocardiopsis sp. NPDC006832 TaxID=3157188 RepID=UPI0033D8311B